MSPLSAPRSLTNLLYHQYLKGEPHNRSTDSLVSNSARSLDEIRASTGSVAPFHWDLRETCRHLTPAFDYISQKLVEEDLSIHLIVSDHSPFVIPVWPLPRKSQLELTRIVRKACSKFDVKDSWLTALGSLNKKDTARLFETYKPDSYVVRRSIVQHEVVYSGEGLTLLSVDHIFTLKQILCTLTKPNWVCHQAREACLASCVELLHRIQQLYTGKPFTKSYVARVYDEIPFQAGCLDEVWNVYNATYCTATIKDVAFQPDFGNMLWDRPPEIDEIGLAEHPSPTLDVHPAFRSDTASTLVDDEIVSPLVASPQVGGDASRGPSIETSSDRSESQYLPPLNILNPLEISYPVVKRPSSSEEAVTFGAGNWTEGPQVPEGDEIESHHSSDDDEGFLEGPAAPSPLRISKSFANTETRRHLNARPSLSAFPLPPKPPSISTAPLLPSTVFNDATESAVDPPPYRALQDSKVQWPEQETDDDGTVEVQTMLNLYHLNGGHTRHYDINEEMAHLEKRETWQSDDVLEDPGAYINSWSSTVERAYPPPTGPLPPLPTTAMAVGDVRCF